MSKFDLSLALALVPISLIAGEVNMNSPYDNPQKEWCYLAKSTTVVGVPFMPEPVMVTWDGAIYTRQAELCFFYGKEMKPVLQRQKTWLNGWMPIVKYGWEQSSVRYETEIFNSPLEGRDVLNTVTFAKVTLKNTGTRPVDALFASAIRGSGEDYRTGKPYFKPDWSYAATDHALIRNNALVYTFSPGAAVEAVPGVPYQTAFRGLMYYITPRTEVAVAKYSLRLAPGEEKVLEFKMPRVPTTDAGFNKQVREADLFSYRNKTVAYWRTLMGGQCVIEVPEKRIRDAVKATVVQALLATKTRNGEQFQTDGVPYPNCFISTVFDYQKAYDAVGLADITKTFALQLKKRQKPDGMFLDTSLTHGKVILSSHGQSLFGLCNHITMTRDKAFGEEVYPMIQKAVACIAKDHRENEYGLMRPSWPYDNEMISGHYTSHNLWCLAALRKSIVVARYLGKSEDERAWLALHKSYEKAVLKAIDASVSEDGYVPTGLYSFITGQKARKGFAEYRTDQDWENCLLAWPTEVLPADDPRVTGTTKRFRDTKYREGIMTYRNGQHLHQYITANTANQDLLAGNAKQALLDIYHVLLHSGSTHEGYENQVSPWTDRLVHGAQPPHAWGASKISTLVRNMFVMEHGGRLGLEPQKRNLYLFSVVSPAWVKVGETIAARNVLTDFGSVSTSMTFKENGASISIDKMFHTDPGQIIIRIPYFVKGATFTTDAQTSSLKGNAVYLSSDVTSVTFKWQLDGDADKTTFQDILMGYRQEPGFWNGHRNKMPAKPKGFLTEAEKARQPAPLSFELVKEAFLVEYNRKGKWITLSAPAIQDASDRIRANEAQFDAKSLTTGKPATASMNEAKAALVNDGQRGDTRKYWEADGSKGPAWWTVDLQKPTDIIQLVVVPYYGSERYYQYTVETSLDGKNWTTMIDQSNNTTPVSEDGYSFEFQPTKVRYIRVNMLKHSLNSGLHLVEVMAY